MGNQTKHIPLESAKNLILTALDQFNPELSACGADILYNEDRLNIVTVAQAKTNIMMCRPAGITIDDLKERGMYIPDFTERYGPHFTRQDNPLDHAVIDFEYDGSLQSIIWLSHELGHAIADYVQIKNEHSFRDFSEAEMEEQAYFIQHIVSRHLKDTMKQPKIKDKDLGQDISKMSKDRASQYTNAGRIFQRALADTADKRQESILKALDQRLDECDFTTEPTRSCASPIGRRKILKPQG